MILGAVVNRVPIALFILAIGPNLTVIHRIWHTWNQTEGQRRAAGRNSGMRHCRRSRNRNRPRCLLLHRRLNLMPNRG